MAIFCIIINFPANSTILKSIFKYFFYTRGNLYITSIVMYADKVVNLGKQKPEIWAKKNYINW